MFSISDWVAWGESSTLVVYLYILMSLFLIALIVVYFSPLHLYVSYGSSMEPTFGGTEIVVINEAAEIEEGDIVAYEADWANKTVIHRVIAEDVELNGNSGYILKGDGNEVTDPYIVSDKQIHGKVIYHFSV